MDVFEEREAAIEDIAANRKLEVLREVEASDQAREARREELRQLEQEREAKKLDQEESDIASLMDPQDIFQQFTAPEDQGGFGDLYNDENTRQTLIDRVDSEIAGGADAMDWRIYEKVGSEIRSRKKQLKENPHLAKDFEREDTIIHMQARRARQVNADNVYFHSAVKKDEPQGREAIRQRFGEEYPEVAGDPDSLREAAEQVDELQMAQFVEKGHPDQSYDTYRAAGDTVRLRKTFEELKQGRGQVGE